MSVLGFSRKSRRNELGRQHRQSMTEGPGGWGLPM